ncbi:MAG: ATP-binding protein [Smithellaceae bacterium]
MQDLAELQKSFESFNKATAELERAYARLEERFAELNQELEEKNAALIKTVAEKEQTKNYLQNILESLINGVIVTDLQGRISTLNSCAEIFTGVRQSDVAGSHIGILFDTMAGHDWQAMNLDEYFKGESGHKVKINDRTLEIFGAPFRSTDGETIGHVLVLRDITRIEKLEEMAKRTEKFESMGEMAANIAHEVRNPLGSIELFASLLLKKLTDQKDRERVVQIISSVKNVDNKISNLLLFTRRPTPQMRRMDLHKVLGEVINFSEQIMEQGGIELSVRYADADIQIAGDAEMIKQVFLNILLNAQQAMPDGGQLSVITRIAPGSLLSSSQRIAEVIFRDAGPGIPEANLSRIFDPFFSNREGGSGLGLAIVHNIVSEHQGSISVENAPQGGMIVNVAFPTLPSMDH